MFKKIITLQSEIRHNFQIIHPVHLSKDFEGLFFKNNQRNLKLPSLGYVYVCFLHLNKKTVSALKRIQLFQNQETYQ